MVENTARGRQAWEMTLKEFLGNSKIVKMGQAAQLRPRMTRGAKSAPAEPFMDGLHIHRDRDDGSGYFHDVVTDEQDKEPVATYDGRNLIVAKPYRRRGIGLELVVDFRTRHPDIPAAETRNKASHALQKKAHRVIVERALKAGMPVSDRVLKDYHELRGRRVNPEEASDLKDLVHKYVGKAPRPRSFRILSEQQWMAEIGESSSDRLTGGVAALTTPDEDILVRQGYEDSAVHELLHAAGFMPVGISDFNNEGITQLVAQAICAEAGIPVRKTYAAEVYFASMYVVPVTGLSLRDFAKKYAKADDKGLFLRDLVWTRYGDKFTQEAGWSGSDITKKDLLQSFRQGIGTILELEYLVDELGVTGGRAHQNPVNAISQLHRFTTSGPVKGRHKAVAWVVQLGPKEWMVQLGVGGEWILQIGSIVKDGGGLRTLQAVAYAIEQIIPFEQWDLEAQRYLGTWSLRPDAEGNPVSRIHPLSLDAWHRKVNPAAALKRKVITSAATSRPQVPALFKALVESGQLQSGARVLDVGAGKYNLGRAYMQDHGIEAVPYDPWNRSMEENEAALKVAEKGSTDACLCANVLNVIPYQDDRDHVIWLCANAVKKSGQSAWFQVYEGDMKGKGKMSGPDSWQENRKTVTYLPEIRKYFKNVEAKRVAGRTVIEASGPKVDR